MEHALPTRQARLPATLKILLVGLCVNRFGSFVSVYLVLFLTGRGYTPTQAGVAASAYGLGNLAASGMGGYLADRVGRRGTIILSMFTSALAMLALSQASSLLLIILLIGLVGLTSGLYRPAAGALFADLVPEQSRVRAFAWYRLAINLGFTAGAALAGLVATHAFFLLFLADAASSVLFGLLALFALPPGSRQPIIRHTPGEKETTQVQGHDRRRFLGFLLGSTVLAIIYFQSNSTFALQVQASGLSNAIFGILLALNGLVVLVLEVPLSTWTQRPAPHRMIALGWALIALGFGLLAQAHSIGMLACCVVLWTLGEIVSHPVSAAYVAQLAPSGWQGRYQGAWDLTWSLGLVIGPVAGTFLYARSAPLLWLICGLGGLVAASRILAAGKHQKTKETSYV